MGNYKHDQFVKKSYSSYKNIGSIICPALNNEKINFNKKGFRHLLYKENNRRHDSQQKRRLKLINYAKMIVEGSNKYSEYRSISSDKDTIHFWSLEKLIENSVITLIIRQINNGPKHFFSIMDKNAKTSQGGLL